MFDTVLIIWRGIEREGYSSGYDLVDESQRANVYSQMRTISKFLSLFVEYVLADER